MINTAVQIFSIGYISGMFTVIIVSAVAVAFASKGKQPEWVDISDKYDDGHWICPDCGADVSFYEQRNNYCSECGTKIDWRKINGESSI